MNIKVHKTCNLFERKGSHTFCVSKAFIRIEHDGSEEIRHIDLKAAGVAVCNKVDEYNYDFGKALAQSRADKRLDRKIEKFLVKLSEKNVKADIKVIEGVNIDLIKRAFGRYDKILSPKEQNDYGTVRDFLQMRGLI